MKRVLPLSIVLAFPALRNIGFIVGCLVGSVVIDLDHIPLFLGSDLLTAQTNRPFTHEWPWFAMPSLLGTMRTSSGPCISARNEQPTPQ